MKKSGRKSWEERSNKKHSSTRTRLELLSNNQIVCTSFKQDMNKSKDFWKNLRGTKRRDNLMSLLNDIIVIVST